MLNYEGVIKVYADANYSLQESETSSVIPSASDRIIDIALPLIRERKSITRVELSTISGLTKTTTDRVVYTLLERGAISTSYIKKGRTRSQLIEYKGDS